jgi:hypothetical protein
MRSIPIIFLVVILLVLLPVIIPVGALLHFVYRMRLTVAAGAFACLSCGRILGREALRLGDAAWEEHVCELRRKYPSRIFRLVRDIHAVCPACGVRYAFLERERTFIRTRRDLR